MWHRGGRPTSILLVDDAKENLELLKFFLKQEGYITYLANSASEAKRLLNEVSIDVILLDVNMPIQDGFSLCRELRETDKFKLLPILFLTSVDREFGYEEAMKNGGDDFLNKPINKKELFAKIRSVARLKELQDELLLEKNRYEMELKMARKVQEQLIPEKHFIWNGARVDTLFQPLFLVSGDFVDTWSESGNLHLVIADCSGHGPGAALIGAMFKMQLYNIVSETDLINRVKLIRRNMEVVLPDEYSISFFYCIIDKKLKLKYINGGHPSPIIYNRGIVEVLNGVGPMIFGIDFQDRDEIHETQLQSGSQILFYTDGAAEAFDSDFRILGEEGLKKLFLEIAENSENPIETIRTRISEYCNGRYSDDMALAVLSL